MKNPNKSVFLSESSFETKNTFKEKFKMPRPELTYSTPVRFELEILKKLREIAAQNERSLSGEVRYRITQSFHKDNERHRSEEVDSK
jgi:hypothetical protein